MATKPRPTVPVRCPCGWTSAVAKHLAGKTIRCGKRCGRRITVPRGKERA